MFLARIKMNLMILKRDLQSLSMEKLEQRNTNRWN